MKKFLLTMCLVGLSVFTFAQSMEVSGKVTSADDGIGLPGVSVTVQGTTRGTTSDVDGMYKIAAEKGATLVYSFVGMNSKSIAIGSQSVINVSLTSDQGLLSEIVVTSTGLNRTAKDVVYANQTVKSEDLMSTPGKNALESLRGKVSGVKISTGSGSVGASTRIVLRAEGSLTGNNTALIVVDGIPIDNSTSGGGDAGSDQSGYSDYGSRFNDINPNDIESITVLKGPSATSLYGSRGASGVLLVTTKKGKDGKAKISVNSSYSTEKAYVLFERQDQYGQGYGTAHFDTRENWAWGPKFDGVVRPWTSAIDADGDGALEALTRPYSVVPNQMQSFFNLGNTLNNSVSLSAGKNGFNYYMSYGSTVQNGTLDNTKYTRNSINLNASSQLTSNLKADFKVSYSLVDQNTATEGFRAFDGNNAYAMAIQSPNSIPFNELRDYKNPFYSTTQGYWGGYSSVNPYFILNEYGNEADVNNLLTKMSLTYSPIKNLDLIARVGNNNVNTEINQWAPKFTPELQYFWGDDLALGTYERDGAIGNYYNGNTRSNNWDVSGLANYNTDIPNVDGLKLNLTAGWNMFHKTFRRISGTTQGGLVVPDWYNLDNSTVASTSEQFSSKYRILGALANVSLAYKDTYFLEYSARNDWSSTLPVANNSFFYQAVGGSIIVSDALNLQSNKILDFAKVRGSFGTTGKDAGLYLLNSVYVGNPQIRDFGDFSLNFPLGGQPAFTTGNTIGNPNLKPELTTTLEIGADLSFFGNRVNLDYTYYSSLHTDQIVRVSLPASSGFTSTTSNIGEMTNKGHEVSLTLRPIQGLVQGLNWDINLNYSKNESNVVKITDEIDELTIGGLGDMSLVAKEGQPFGAYKVIDFRRDSQGRVIVDATGLPLSTSEQVFAGSYQPDFMASVGTRIGYKGFSLSGLLDIKQGGKFYSWTKDQSTFNGTNLSTLEFDRGVPFVFPNSVTEEGEVNTIEIADSETYFTTGGAVPASENLLDASYVKLRELALNYAIPSKVLDKLNISNANIGLFANNVKFWLPSDNTYADPEVNGAGQTGNYVGIETSQVPPSKSYGVKIGFTF
ncbi:SusC/RagA family TonB-linked outer membrane protein [uncultured Arcticibacterium sp.]|uniref:SusC/RagA family TonB-linked outer membrane protein n=1 Tax=uncultured Arcticibacterium sp. TaxID=2173042 RepID=UPI0030F82850